MLTEVQKAFNSKTCIVSGFGNQQSDAVAYKTIGINPHYIFLIRDSIIYMLSGKYKFTLSSFESSTPKLFPKLTRDGDRDTAEITFSKPEERISELV